jgi:hypothetical protein
LSAPENTFVTAAVVSATPSMRPIVTMEAPRTVAMNAGSRLWISSEEMSMNNEPSPRAQMPAGKPRNVAGALRDVSGFTSPPPPLIAPSQGCILRVVIVSIGSILPVRKTNA